MIKRINKKARNKGYAIFLNSKKDRKRKGKYSLFEECKGLQGREIHGFVNLSEIDRWLNSTVNLSEIEDVSNFYDIGSPHYIHRKS